MVFVKVKTTREVELTSENEAEILDAEWDRRYGNANLEVGDEVRFAANGKPRQRELLGNDHVGRLGIVVSVGMENTIRVLAIAPDGEFVEVWTHEMFVEKV